MFLLCSLDQDVYGHVFYADLVDLLMPPSPPSPKASSNGGGAKGPRKRSATSSEPGAPVFGNRHKILGAYSEDEIDISNSTSDVGSDSVDGWLARTHPRRQTGRPPARRGHLAGRGRSPVAAVGMAFSAAEEEDADDGFIRSGPPRALSLESHPRRSRERPAAGFSGRSLSRELAVNSRVNPRSPGRGDARGYPSRGRDKQRSTRRDGAAHRGIQYSHAD